MGKQIFDYYKPTIYETSYLYYGFHFKKGRLSIDTKRLKKAFAEQGCEVGSYFSHDEFLTLPRNRHYFVPKKKTAGGYKVNHLVGCLTSLLRDWKEEYLPMIESIKTPGQVRTDSFVNNIQGTTDMDGELDRINELANIKASLRAGKYEDLLKSIYIQYIQKVQAEYFRVLYLLIGKHGDYDLGEFNDIVLFVNQNTKKKKKSGNPIYQLKHYKDLVAISYLSNFTKHHSAKAYSRLYDNGYKENANIKEYLNSYVYGDDKHKYQNGMYAANWVKVDANTVEYFIVSLIAFSYEFCELVYNESPSDSDWNYDRYFIKCIDRFIKEVINLDYDEDPFDI